MPTFIEKLRGFVQPIIRGYQAIKAGISHTLEVFRTYAPALEESAIREDYAAYEAGTAIEEVEVPISSEKLLPWYLHGKSPVKLSAEFKYDVKALYENIKGETVEGFWSVLDDRRLTTEEILELGEPFAVDSPTVDLAEFPFHGPMEVIACWRRD